MVIFEDEVYESLLPLAYAKPVYDLVSGARTFRQRILDAFPRSEYALFTREYLAAYLREREKGVRVNMPGEMWGPALFVNGLLIPDGTFLKRVSKAGRDVVGAKEDRLVFAYLSEARARELAERLLKPLSAMDILRLRKEGENFVQVPEAELLAYPWELVKWSGRLIARDTAAARGGRASIHPKATVLGRRARLVARRGARVEAGAVIDVRAGPVYMGEGSVVGANALVEGPAYLGAEAVVEPLAALRGGTSVGRRCRVGGILEGCVLQEYVEKPSDGLLGYSCLGSWVSLGPSTTLSHTARLPGPVRMRLGGKVVETGEPRLGSFLSDYVRASSGTIVHAGCRVGVASQIEGVVEGDVPSFAVWRRAGETSEAVLEAVIEAQRRMYAARGVEQTAADITLMKRLFEATHADRRSAGLAQPAMR